MMQTQEIRTPYQALHLARLKSLFDVDLSPSDALSGPALDAWMDEVENDVLEALFRSEQ